MPWELLGDLVSGNRPKQGSSSVHPVPFSAECQAPAPSSACGGLPPRGQWLATPSPRVGLPAGMLGPGACPSAHSQLSAKTPRLPHQLPRCWNGFPRPQPTLPAAAFSTLGLLSLPTAPLPGLAHGLWLRVHV